MVCSSVEKRQQYVNTNLYLIGVFEWRIMAYIPYMVCTTQALRIKASNARYRLDFSPVVLPAKLQLHVISRNSDPFAPLTLSV